MRPGGVSFVIASVALGGPATTQAADSHWEPGERTTSTLKGEVDTPGTARSGDGVYGRLDGDLDLGAGLGVDAMRDGTAGAARLSLHYFSSLGVYASYADALGRERELARSISFGVDLRPLFIPRWLQDRQQGPSGWDLTIDSLAVGVGAFYAEPPGRSFGDARGFELSAGLGVPLAGIAGGPWLEGRALLRWPNPGAGERADGALVAVLSWHSIFFSGLSD
ncbi:MAG: hypothetical protein IPI67_15265 [Myxococcales bacterium]|nr:hypothetical protein [Myxococcales bacterium]